MGFPALAPPVAAEAALVLDLETLFQRLPAATRAEVNWTRPTIEAGLKRLLTEPADDALLDEVARALLRPIKLLSRVFTQWLAANPDEVRTSVMDSLQLHEDRLCTFLPDADSRDTLAWVLGFLRSFFVLSMAHVPPEQLAAFDEAEIDRALMDARYGGFMRAQVALMAAVEAAKAETQPERAGELLDAALLNLLEFKKVLRREGFWVSAFPNETSDERRDNLQRYALRLRETLTAEDWQTLDRARLGDLR